MSASLFRKITIILCSVVMVAGLVACGGGDGGSFTVPTSQMGGARQGAVLTLGPDVTTLAGKASLFNYPAGVTTIGADLYVVDTGNNCIRKLDSSGTSTIVAGSPFATQGSADGTGTDARFFSPTGITNDGVNLYVTDSSNYTIRKIDLSTTPATVTTLAGTAGSFDNTDGTGASAGFLYPTGITYGGGKLYVADTENQSIRTIVISTGVVTTLAGPLNATVTGPNDGTGAAAQFDNPEGITINGAGTELYVADTGNGAIRKVVIGTGAVNTGVVTTINTGFNNPRGITTDGTDLYLADTANNTIRKIVIGGAVTTLAGTAGIPGYTDATGAAARFNDPHGIISDGTNLYVADTNNQTIRKIVISSGVATTQRGTAIAANDGTGAAARFNEAYGVTSDGTNLYVADTNNNTIRKIVISTGVVTTLAGSGTSGSANGVGTSAEFAGPEGITTDGTNLYVADTGNSTIRKIVISTGVVTTLSGTAFATPTGITTDGTNLYVADAFNCDISKIVIIGGTVSNVAGSNTTCGFVDNVSGTSAEFSSPSGITTDGTNLYVADSGNNTIRKIVISSRLVTTVAGDVVANAPGYVDSATGTAARFNNPYGITMDGTNLYVADTQNHTIRKIVISSGVVTTVAGVGGSKGSIDGSLAAARFENPLGITTNGTGLFVTSGTFGETVRAIY